MLRTPLSCLGDGDGRRRPARPRLDGGGPEAVSHAGTGGNARRGPEEAPRSGPTPAPAAASRTGCARGHGARPQGHPLRNSGTDPRGFDCSGFTQYVFARHGIALPREVREQFRIGREVRGDPAPGDLLFFTTWKPAPRT